MAPTLDVKIESLLFWKAEPLPIKNLAELFGVGESEIVTALETLKERLAGRGICLIQKDKSVAFGSIPELGPLIQKISKEELNRNLGRASLEALAIVLYLGPISKTEIDYIRGVNSSFILRNLLVRGLVEKIPDPKDARRLLYRPSFDLLGHLGITDISELPEYQETKARIESFKNQTEKPSEPA